MNALVLLPLLPLVGFLVNGTLGPRLPRPLVGLVACAMPALSFALAAWLFAGLGHGHGGGGPAAIHAHLFTWAATAGFHVDAALTFDPVSAVMCLIITGIGTLIHVYSIGYMHGDPGYARYFAYLNLFVFFMLLLVLGSNLVVLFVGWEGVGLASYLLIGFWFSDPAKTAAGVKAFVVNRVGDTGFLLAAFLIQAQAGTLDFAAVNAHFVATPAGGTTAIIALLLLVGACGKSAQIPLHVWLPDAMAGPTPVSALIHAATMVTAGVYLLARLNGLFLAAPDAMTVVAWLGAITALAGASLGTVQFNLKKVLAYSTMSQIGLMVMACGVGAFSAGMFHLMTHAFFKAALFLAAGSVLHALGGEEDMRRMGGLARPLPFTFGVFLVGTLALCGLPPLAGFFSKDEILWSAWSSAHGSAGLWAVGSMASFLTAFYMFRAVFITFLGRTRAGEASDAPLHDAPRSMAIPLAVLAAGSVVAGFFGLPAFWQEHLGVGSPFFELLAPVLPHPPVRGERSPLAEPVLMAVAVAVALAGIGTAWLRYGRRGADGARGVDERDATRGSAVATAAVDPAPGPSAVPVPARDALQRLLQHGYYFDAAYDRVVAAAGWLSTAVLAAVERAIANLTVGAPAEGGSAAGRWFARLENGQLQAYVIYALLGLALVLAWGVVRG